MRRDDIPMMADVLTRAIAIDARNRALLWATARLCYCLRRKGVLSDTEVGEMLDPSQLEPTIPEELRAIAFDTISALRNQCLGKMPSRH
jgi:hypothetical protein